MKFTLKLIENNSTIAQDILKALLPEIKNYMINSINIVKNQLPSLINNAIINTTEYNSLLNGQLKYEFGIPDSSTKLAGLLDIWSTNIAYEYKIPTIQNSRIKSSFSAKMIRIDFADVLYSDYALVIDSVRGYSLPWLEWLLLEGNKTIISNYEVQLGANKFSRTGNAIMKGSRKSWKVPSEFSGTSRDNWITRAIDGAVKDIENLLNKAFKL